MDSTLFPKLPNACLWIDVNLLWDKSMVLRCCKLGNANAGNSVMILCDKVNVCNLLQPVNVFGSSKDILLFDRSSSTMILRFRNASACTSYNSIITLH